MWDTIINYMNSFLGAFFLLISIVTIPEIRHSNKRIAIVSILILILVVLGIVKNSRDEGKEIEYKAKTDSLLNKVDNLATSYRNDSINNVLFLKTLETKYGIKRDSSSNLPVPTETYYTNIGKARDVHIGPGN